MNNQVQRREVQRCNDPFGIPACFYWTVDEVADWIESIGYGKYKENFRSNFINGRKLLTVDACTLPKLGIVHFGDILTIAKIIRFQLGVCKNKQFNPYGRRKDYMDTLKAQGRRWPSLTYSNFMYRNQLVLDAKTRYFKTKGYTYRGWCMDPIWNRSLLKEETEMRHTLVANEKKFRFGNSTQERLLEATLREFNASKDHTTDSPICNDTRATPLSSRTCQKNRIKEERERYVREKRRMKRRVANRKDTPHLPLILCWDKMEQTKGYPPLKVESQYICGLKKI